MRKLFAAMLLFLMATCVAFADPVFPKDLVLDTPSVEILLGETAQIQYHFTPDNVEYENLAVSFEPADESIATVDETGVVTGVSPGSTTVTVIATDGTNDPLTAECTVTVNPINLSGASMSLNKTTWNKTGSAIKPTATLKYKGETLTEGTDYILSYKNNTNVGTATVTATALEGSRFTGSKSVNFTIVPKKPAAAAISSVKSSKPNVVVTWKKVACTGYQLQVSLNSDFSSATKFTVKATTKKVPKLKHNKVYYFRVRAYNTENGKTTYGNWSKSSSKVSTTGPVGDKYSQNGVLIKDKTVQYGGNYYYYNTSGIKSGCAEKMWNKVKNTKSGTKYLIAVDCHKNRTCIYKGKKGNWKLLYYWKCSTGKKSTPTIKGTFKVCGKVSHFGESHGYTCWHATRIKYEYYFHSVLYKPYSTTKIKNGKLGANISKGCIRLKKSNAKWIYNNCKGGTRIVIY